MDYMLMPLRRYADFRGRSRRKEYWMFALLVTIVFVALALVLGAFAGGTDFNDFGVGPLFIIIALLGIGILIPSLAVQVRRFHDQDRSGWFCLLGLLPYVGGVIIIVFMCLEGTRGPNRFGADPKGTADLGGVFS